MTRGVILLVKLLIKMNICWCYQYKYYNCYTLGGNRSSSAGHLVPDHLHIPLHLGHIWSLLQPFHCSVCSWRWRRTHYLWRLPRGLLLAPTQHCSCKCDFVCCYFCGDIKYFSVSNLVELSVWIPVLYNGIKPINHTSIWSKRWCCKNHISISLFPSTVIGWRKWLPMP